MTNDGERTTSGAESGLPLAYRRAVARWGEPVGIEQARRRWADLVASAEQGRVTLIRHEDRDVWAALIPVRDLTEAVDRLPVWSLRDARPKLGELVDAAQGSWRTGSPATAQVLARHRRPVAALVAALDLEMRADLGQRLDVDTALRDGATITLTYHPDQPGRVGEHGDLISEPEPGGFMAIANDDDGAQLGCGFGTTAIAALLSLYRPGQSSDLPAELYDEAPF
jgi:hypothetical protein